MIRIGHEDYKADLLDMMTADKVPEALRMARIPHLTYRGRMTLHLGGKGIRFSMLAGVTPVATASFSFLLIGLSI